MREIGISPRFSRDKFVPLQTKQRYSTRDISSEVFLTLFFRGFVPFLSLADFVSRDKNLQVVDLQRLKSCFGELVTATTSNLQEELVRAGVLPKDYDFEAHKELVPMQPGDVPVTYADTIPLEQDFGFKPNTSLREGLRLFAEWYAEYYRKLK